MSIKLDGRRQSPNVIAVCRSTNVHFRINNSYNVHQAAKRCLISHPPQIRGWREKVTLLFRIGGGRTKRKERKSLKDVSLQAQHVTIALHIVRTLPPPSKLGHATHPTITRVVSSLWIVPIMPAARASAGGRLRHEWRPVLPRMRDQ
jgi:hypothetical protein